MEKKGTFPHRQKFRVLAWKSSRDKLKDAFAQSAYFPDQNGKNTFFSPQDILTPVCQVSQHLPSSLLSTTLQRQQAHKSHYIVCTRSCLATHTWQGSLTLTHLNADGNVVGVRECFTPCQQPQPPLEEIRNISLTVH